jgi:hypothetical protein
LMSMGVRSDSFMPLTEAFAENLSNNRFRVGPGTIIVQRDRISLFWSQDVDEPSP